MAATVVSLQQAKRMLTGAMPFPLAARRVQSDHTPLGAPRPRCRTTACAPCSSVPCCRTSFTIDPASEGHLPALRDLFGLQGWR